MKRVKCGYANKYKATRKPTCGCETCEAKWNNKLLDDDIKKFTNELASKQKPSDIHFTPEQLFELYV